MEQGETERHFTREQERHLLRLAKKLFLEDHPNPARIGCPDSAMLRSVAHGALNLSQAERDAVLEHLSICSPCFRQFYSYRRMARLLVRVPVCLGLAAVLIAAGVLTYGYFTRPQIAPMPERQIATQQAPTPEYQQALLDLRGRSPVRGESPGVPSRQPPALELPRGHLVLTILLPVGSEEGLYSIRLGRPGQEAMLTVKGRAQIEDGSTSIEVRIVTADLSAGDYILGIREEPWSWAEHAVKLK